MHERIELARPAKEKKERAESGDSKVYAIEVIGTLPSERSLMLAGGKK